MTSSFPAGHRPALSPIALVALMALLMALQALAIDAMLPALPQIGRDLGVTQDNHRQLVVGIYILASGLGCVFPGVLSDRFGRRPVLIFAVGIYAVLALACAFVTDFETLLVLRVLQGFGSAGLSVVPGAIVRDLHDGDRMARMSSTIQAVFITVPVLAPSLGQGVLLVADWRWIFAFLSAVAVVAGVWFSVRMPETQPPEYRRRASLREVAVDMVQVAISRESSGYAWSSGLLFGAVFGYINSAQQIIGEHFGAGEWFAVIFGASATAIAVANLINSRIVEIFGTRRVSHAGLLAFILVSVVQIWAASMQPHSLALFLPLIALNMGLLGFVSANFAAIALQPFGRTAGTAASAQTFLRMVVSALIGMGIGQAYDGTARPLAVAFLACGLTALVLVLYSEKGRLFGRRPPEFHDV